MKAAAYRNSRLQRERFGGIKPQKLGLVCCLASLLSVSALATYSSGTSKAPHHPFARLHHPEREQCETVEDSGAADLLGVNGVTKVYETLDFFFFQSLFDKLSSDFIPPLFNALTKLEIKKIDKPPLNLTDDVSLDIELEHLKISNATISPSTPILTINTDEGLLFAFSDLTLNITADYSYIMDPPIFADIGEASFLFSPTNFSVNVGSRLYAIPGGQYLELELSNMHIESQAEPFTSFVGISDFSEVASNTVNTLAAVLKNRVMSFINGGDTYGLDDKLQAIVNKIINLVPDEVHLGNGLYIDGWLYTNFQV